MRTPILLKSKLILGLLPSWSQATFLLLLGLLVTFFSQAQTKVWDKTIGGSRNDYFKVVHQTSDGGYILGGTSGSGISDDKSQANKGPCGEYCTSDYWIVKLKADGSKEWDKTIGGDRDDYLTSLQLTSDGGYMLGGSSNSGKSGDKSEENKGKESEYGYPTDYWIVKLKADGTKEWDKTIGGDSGDELTSLQQTRDGDYILGGTSSSGKSGDKTEISKGYSDLWLVKIDGKGQKIWDKTYGGMYYDYLASVIITPDGGYLIGSAFSDVNSQSILTLIKLKADGTKVWEKSIDEQFSSQQLVPQITADGDYVVGYGVFSLYEPDPTNFGIIKIKADGTQVWNKSFGGSGEEVLTSL
ncbi:hypothetical protein [Adhaeribacter radiodurans]|uniref:T9SS C-terminal target domain-containing protein n=1 Tax=Adhaeribacter radiodurans TaxID=2745197 RepID=A0A7L7L7J8_9BACT|nr:hypothetical protein [Adhaeribacter radiodurans]QMU28780.1 hypothetical protein HUW48_12365 [Adhaeribacter radiodurans]